MNVLNGITNTYSVGKSQTNSVNTVGEKVAENQSSVVQLSEEAVRASYSGAPAKDSMTFNVFGIAQHRLPPQPSSALEDMVYRRGGQHIDFTQLPPVWPSDNKVLNSADWLHYEEELDKQTNDRIDIYERAMVAGLSKEEIIAEIKQYNASLHPRYSHSTFVENRPNDIERPLYERPPAGTQLSLTERQNDYDNMVTGMARALKEIKKYLT